MLLNHSITTLFHSINFHFMTISHLDRVITCSSPSPASGSGNDNTLVTKYTNVRNIFIIFTPTVSSLDWVTKKTEIFTGLATQVTSKVQGPGTRDQGPGFWCVGGCHVTSGGTFDLWHNQIFCMMIQCQYFGNFLLKNLIDVLTFFWYNNWQMSRERWP